MVSTGELSVMYLIRRLGLQFYRTCDNIGRFILCYCDEQHGNPKSTFSDVHARLSVFCTVGQSQVDDDHGHGQLMMSHVCMDILI